MRILSPHRRTRLSRAAQKQEVQGAGFRWRKFAAGWALEHVLEYAPAWQARIVERRGHYCMLDGGDVLGVRVILETSSGRAARIRTIIAPLNIRALGDQALVVVVALALVVQAFVAEGVRAPRARVAQAFVTEGLSTWAVRALVRRARTGQEGVLDGSRGIWHR
jgi:hypothetical protein